ncbi:hypothetical protein D3C85_173200 [compost metagenome]
MNLPSERYFEAVKTEEDYKKFKATGMAYEFEYWFPSTWAEHQKMVEFKEKYEVKEEDGFERSTN